MSQAGDMYVGWYVTVTRPGGQTEKITLRASDAVGGTAATYTPKVLGEYKFQLFYPGQTLITGTWNGTKMAASESEIVTLTVQQEQIGALYQSPTLPSEYWTRPIYATNWAWADIGGSWFGLAAASFATTGKYDAVGNVQLYTTAPNTGHIVWTKPTHFGGVVGAPISSGQESQYTSTSILINFYEPIILNGVLFFTHRVSASSSIVGWSALDLRTGEKVWERTAGEAGNEVLKMGQIMRFHTQQEYGATAYLWSTAGSGRMRIYDAASGNYLANVSGVQSASYILDYSGIQQGTLLGYYASGGYITMWNSTNMITNSTWDKATFCKFSGNYDWWKGIMWNTTEIPKTGLNVNMNSSQSMSLAAVTPEILLTRYQPSMGSFMEMNAGWQITAGFDAKTGQKLWGPLNQSLPVAESIALLCARDGYYVLHNKDTDNAYIYSLKTGALLWGPIQLQGNAYSTISRGGEIAYGKAYIWDLGGYVSAINLETGEIAWTLTPRSAGYDTPFGVYPLWHFGTHSICDGKLFLSEGRMYDPPLSPSYRLVVNCTDGSIVWDILHYSGRITGAHADTYFVDWNSFDNHIYSFGKGPTTTTVVTPNVQVPIGNKVLIQGSVMDTSAGTKTYEKQSRFPNGVPAIADANMSVWMEYVYMQQTKPKFEDISGVPVHLTALDPNNNWLDLGTVTSDANGKYSFAFNPDNTGIYKIFATFEGSESYYTSSAETSVLISEAVVAPTAAPTTAPPTIAPPTEAPTTAAPTTAAPKPTENFNTAIYVSVAAVVLIVVIAAIAVFLRKRK